MRYTNSLHIIKFCICTGNLMSSKATNIYFPKIVKFVKPTFYIFRDIKMWNITGVALWSHKKNYKSYDYTAKGSHAIIHFNTGCPLLLYLHCHNYILKFKSIVNYAIHLHFVSIYSIKLLCSMYICTIQMLILNVIFLCALEC